MRVFVYEFVCGGGLAGQPLPRSLATEGWAMLSAVLEDFSRIDGLSVTALLDQRFHHRPVVADQIELIEPGAEQDAVGRHAAAAEWTLVIAPETGGVLEQRCRWVEAAGGRLLGCPPVAVAAAADKLRCAGRLQAAGVPTVVGQVVDLSAGLPNDYAYPAVLKPLDGAGSTSTFLLPAAEAAPSALQPARAEGLSGRALLQPYVSGTPASIALLIGPSGAVLALPPAEQHLSADGRFRYLGGRVPVGHPQADRAVRLGQLVAAAMPELRGYVGIDLVLGPDPAGAQDAVIEVNPRLTTSYVGLRRLARSNLAAVWLQMASGRPAPPLTWRPGTVCFDTEGGVTYRRGQTVPSLQAARRQVRSPH